MTLRPKIDLVAVGHNPLNTTYLPFTIQTDRDHGISYAVFDSYIEMKDFLSAHPNFFDGGVVISPSEIFIGWLH